MEKPFFFCLLLCPPFLSSTGPHLHGWWRKNPLKMENKHHLIDCWRGRRVGGHDATMQETPSHRLPPARTIPQGVNPEYDITGTEDSLSFSKFSLTFLFFSELI
jgi:hypothetical protein